MKDNKIVQDLLLGIKSFDPLQNTLLTEIQKAGLGKNLLFETTSILNTQKNSFAKENAKNFFKNIGSVGAIDPLLIGSNISSISAEFLKASSFLSEENKILKAQIESSIKVVDSQKKILQEQISTAIKYNQSIIKNNFDQMTGVINSIMDIKSKNFLGFVGNIKNMLSFYEELDGKIDILTKDGWYLSEDMIDTICGVDGLSYIKNVMNKWDTKSVKLEFSKRIYKYLRSQGLELKKGIIKSFPKRKKILNVIFKLHKERNYIASIPLALSQSDGMCKDIFVESGFYESVKTNSKKYAQKISKLMPKDEKLIFKTTSNQISSDNKNDFILHKYQNEQLTALNRHNIMHGESVNYGNKVNSIKSILLLDFMRGLKDVVEKK